MTQQLRVKTLLASAAQRVDAQPALEVIAAQPITLDLPVMGRSVTVVGRGPSAAVAAAALLSGGARVRVVAGSASDVTPSLADLASRGRIELVNRPYRTSDLADMWLVYPRTGDQLLDTRIREEALRARVWCVDAAAAKPVVSRSVGEPAAGKSPGTGDARHVGRVTIVGGGPGDPELITVRGRQLLADADVVVHDRLAPLSLLARLPSSTILIDAAKVPGGAAMSQSEINRHLVEYASQGLHVVRLKGGDPFVFGRGMEEVDACVAEGIPVDVVPGVSSAVAVPELAGVSLTHRGLAQAFTVVSGHLAPGHGQSNLNWEAMAKSGATLVLMMAVETLPVIVDRLCSAGMDGATPAIVVQDGASPQQRVIRSELARLVLDAADVLPPAVTVIGAVADHVATYAGISG